ncbi:hypothetical protein Drorol1_Dr00008179 [Drosera rotundifolia]
MTGAILRMMRTAVVRSPPAIRHLLHPHSPPPAPPALSSFHRSLSSTTAPPPRPPTPPPVPIIAAASSASAALAELDVADLPLSSPTIAKPLVQNSLQPGVVIYDGVCHLCHTGVKWVISVDKERKIKFCCLQSEAAEPYLRVCGVEREDVLRRFVFVECLGRYHRASTAALWVLSYLPFPYSALSYLSIVPAPLRDAVYDFVAKRRYDWFGKEEDCIVLQEPEMLERFIDAEELLKRRRSKFY